MRFSANLGFLWTNLALPDAIHAAREAGFDAVECHWPYDTPAQETREALEGTGLPMLGLNTSRGDTERGENGLAALVGREREARAAVEQALGYAARVDAKMVHVMAGKAAGPAAEQAYLETLRFASDAAGELGITVLIEPLNRHDAPGYFLRTTDQAVDIIDTLDRPNIRLMFDCYHVARTEGDVTTRLRNLVGHIGHIQVASVPDRGPPGHGELDYRHVFRTLDELGWDAPIGAEFRMAGGGGIRCADLQPG
ncbi:MAG TPA: TIM barrel protein [Devosiaceae bacterium]